MWLLYRVVGSLFVIVGLTLFVIACTFALQRESVLYAARNWKTIAGLSVMACMFLLAGWYMFRFDPNAPDRVEPTAFTCFLAGHRRLLQMFAAIGCLVSTGRFGAACIGANWPGRWAELPLLVGLGFLLYGSKTVAGINGHRSWMSVPNRPRLIKNAESIIVFICLVLFAGVRWFPRLSHWNGLQQPPDIEDPRNVTHIVLLGAMAILYALETLFLSFREFGSSTGGISTTAAHE